MNKFQFVKKEVGMPFKGVVREFKEMRDGIGSMSKKGEVRDGQSRGGWGHHHHNHNNRQEEEEPLQQQGGDWANMPPELLLDIIGRVEASETSWPARKHVVACASVCQSWREVAKEVVRTPEQSGRITFPISLKQPGPSASPIQCFIRRERGTHTYRLYLGLSPAEQNDKLLFSARKVRRATTTGFVVTLSSDDFSRSSSTYIGKLRSNFLGTKFTVYDSQPPCDTAAVLLSNRCCRRFHSKQVSPRVPAGNYHIATIAYELNVLRTRGPRRMQCTMHCIPLSSIREGGTAPTPTAFVHSLDEPFSRSVGKGKEPVENLSSTSMSESLAPNKTRGEPLILKNKVPRWHEQLQCWCLNFRGRVTVASVKNFQLVAAVDPSEQITSAEQEKVILQFGKIGKDIFTMDYRYPLSAFQAFTICLTSFDTKPACE